VVAWTLLLATAAGASRETSLDDVYRSGNGMLEFSDFDFFGVDRELISLTVLDDGIRFGSLAPSSGYGFEAFAISYKVSAVDASRQISGASLRLDSGTHRRGFGKVLALQRLVGVGGARSEGMLLETFDIRDHWRRPRDEERFAEPQNVLQVWDKVLVFSKRGRATWLSSTNRFSVLPAPGTASLIGLGLIGLLVSERRRR
jgi:hypothetical protein